MLTTRVPSRNREFDAAKYYPLRAERSCRELISFVPELEEKKTVFALFTKPVVCQRSMAFNIFTRYFRFVVFTIFAPFFSFTLLVL